MSLLVSADTPVQNSTLMLLDADTGQATVLGHAGYVIDAIGYSPDQELTYGIATIRNGWPVPNRGRLISITRSGAVTDLGPIHGDAGLLGGLLNGLFGLARPMAGAVLGDRLYLRVGGMLYAVDIAPDSGAFGRVVGARLLLSPWPASAVGDVAPAGDGLLYGVAGLGWGHNSLVAINPRTGASWIAAPLPDLPGAGPFGATVIDGDTLYVLANQVHGRAVLFRVALGGDHGTSEVGTLPPVGVSDAAGCLAPVATPPPPPPTTTPPPPPVTTTRPTSRPTIPPTTTTTVPPKPTTTTPTPTPKTTPTLAAIVPPPTTTVPPTTAVVPPTTEGEQLPVAVPAVAPAANLEVTQQRRWAVVLVLMILGGGAAAGRAAVAARKRDTR